MAHVYHWKHGWIPLDHVALKRGGHPSQATGPIKGAKSTSHATGRDRTGIKSRRHAVHAAATLHKVPAGPERQQAAAHLKASAIAIGHQDVITPKTAAHRAADAARTAKARKVEPGEQALFAGGSAEQHLVRHPDGTVTFTPERQALHDRIIAGMLAGNTPVANPAYNVMGGGPASGKSTMEARTPQLRDNAALVNPDQVKEALPEYRQITDGTQAAFTHEESSYVAKRAVAEAFARRINVTLDGTGDSNVESLRGKIKAARAAGYAVNGYYVTVDTEEAIRRSDARAQRLVDRGEVGRFVPHEVVRGTHESISRTLPEVAHEFDTLQLFDNNADHIRPVAEKRPGGDLTVTDPALWRDFLNKAPENRGRNPGEGVVASRKLNLMTTDHLNSTLHSATDPELKAAIRAELNRRDRPHARADAADRAQNFQDFASMTPAQRSDAAAQMFGTGSKQHVQAILKGTGRLSPAEHSALSTERARLSRVISGNGPAARGGSERAQADIAAAKRGQAAIGRRVRKHVDAIEAENRANVAQVAKAQASGDLASAVDRARERQASRAVASRKLNLMTTDHLQRTLQTARTPELKAAIRDELNRRDARAGSTVTAPNAAGGRTIVAQTRRVNAPPPSANPAQNFPDFRGMTPAQKIVQTFDLNTANRAAASKARVQEAATAGIMDKVKALSTHELEQIAKRTKNATLRRAISRELAFRSR